MKKYYSAIIFFLIGLLIGYSIGSITTLSWGIKMAQQYLDIEPNDNLLSLILIYKQQIENAPIYANTWNQTQYRQVYNGTAR